MDIERQRHLEGRPTSLEEVLARARTRAIQQRERVRTGGISQEEVDNAQWGEACRPLVTFLRSQIQSEIEEAHARNESTDELNERIALLLDVISVVLPQVMWYTLKNKGLLRLRNVRDPRLDEAVAEYSRLRRDGKSEKEALGAVKRKFGFSRSAVHGRRASLDE